MKPLFFIALLLAACTPTSAPQDPPDALDEFYSVAKKPDWPTGRIAFEYRASSFTLRNDSLFQRHDDGRVTGWPLVVLQSGAETWFCSPDNAHRYRGILDGAGKIIIMQPDKRPGPVQHINFQRVQ